MGDMEDVCNTLNNKIHFYKKEEKGVIACSALCTVGAQ